MNGEVLVVGAGPTGMTLALQLARHGVAVRVIERHERRREGSKALSINPSSLDILADLSIAPEMLRRGRRMTRLTVMYEGVRLASVDFERLSGSNAHFLMLPQPQTEAIMEGALKERGIPLDRGRSLCAMSETEGGVLATTRDGAGRSECCEYSYVVGCDGARSTARQLLGVNFSGFDYSMHFLLADLVVDWDGPRDEGFYLVGERGFVIVLPLTDKHHRVVVKVDGPYQEAKPVTFRDVSDAVHNCVGARLRLRDPIWLSGAPFYNRLAATNRKGRVFLAGDASHLFSPIGGFGMNTGIGDAFNLAWKLAYVLQGHAQPTLLDSYEAERLLLAKRLVAQTDLSTSLIARLDRHRSTDEQAWLPSMKNRRRLRSLRYSASGRMSSYELTPSGRAGFAVAPKCLAPFVDALVLGAKGSVPGRHALVAWLPNGSERPQWEHALRDLEMRYRPMLRLVILDSAKLPAAWGISRPALALVRPDFYVEHVASGAGAQDEMERYMGVHYTP